MSIISRVKSGLMARAVAFAGILGGAVLATNPASATLVSVDGVGLYVNNGGQIEFVQDDKDVVIQHVGDILRGVGVMDNIKNTIGGTSYLQPCAAVGCAGNFVADVFGNLKIRAEIFNPSTGNTDVYLTNASPTQQAFLNYYILPNNPNQNVGGVGAIATDIANSTSATLWLSLVPEVFDAQGDVFHIVIPGSPSGLGSFGGVAQGDALLDVTGGDAASYLDTNGILNTYSSTYADFSFVGNAERQVRSPTNNACPPGPPSTAANHQDFCVLGTDNLFNQQPKIPEPGSVLLLGTGLLSLAGARLKRRRARS